MAVQLSDPAAIEKALNTRGTLARWLHFVGGAEFTQLTPLLRGMQLVDLMRLPPSGLALEKEAYILPPLPIGSIAMLGMAVVAGPRR